MGLSRRSCVEALSDNLTLPVTHQVCVRKLGQVHSQLFVVILSVVASQMLFAERQTLPQSFASLLARQKRLVEFHNMHVGKRERTFFFFVVFTKKERNEGHSLFAI